MGIFGRHSTDSAATASTSKSISPRRSNHYDNEPVPTETRRSGLFGSRRNDSPAAASGSSGSVRHSNSVLHRGGHQREDPAIFAAREQVTNAEGAERAADRALIAARQAVKDAREHVKRLEREAAEEARLAKIKQDQAASISKRAKPLGRFGP